MRRHDPSIYSSHSPKGVVVEDALLREPRLWVPGQKPVSPWKIDQTHPMSKSLAVYTPLQMYSVPIYFYGVFERLNMYDSEVWEVYNNTPMLSGTSTWAWMWTDRTCVASPTNGGYTLAVKIHIKTVPTDWTYITAVSPYQPGIAFSDVGEIYGYCGSAVYSGVTPSVGDTLSIVLTRQDGTNANNIYINGEYKDGVTNGAATSAGKFVIGAGDWEGVYGNLLWYAIEYAGFWSRGMSQKEITELHSDPYQFLIPA